MRCSIYVIILVGIFLFNNPTTSKAQRFYFQIVNGIAIPFGTFKDPDFFFKGGDAAGFGYFGQMSVSYQFDRMVNAKIIGGVQTHKFNTSKIGNLYRSLSQTELYSFEQKNYQLNYIIAGPELNYQIDQFHFYLTAAIGTGYLGENLIKFHFQNPQSEDDAIAARFDGQSGSVMFVQVNFSKEMNDLLELGISFSHLGGAFKVNRVYEYFRQNKILETREIQEKVQPRTLNINLNLQYRF